MDSDDYNTKEERVAVLKNEIKVYSSFEDAEFELYNVNGFSNSRASLPGASSWDYKFALKIDPSDIEKWTTGMVKTGVNDYDDRWMKELVRKRADNWQTETQPEFYTRNKDDVIMIVFRPEGVLFKHVVQE